MDPKQKGNPLLRRFRISTKTAPYYFMAPAVIVFSCFMIYPIISSLILSFQEFEAGTYTFAGLRNYQTLLQDPIFWQSLKNTLIYLIIQVPIMIVLSLGLAVLVEEKFLRGRSFFRMSTFYPQSRLWWHMRLSLSCCSTLNTESSIIFLDLLALTR